MLKLEWEGLCSSLSGRGYAQAGAGGGYLSASPPLPHCILHPCLN